MSKSRLQKTLADYTVIAIAPVLIMLLVGSLVFFLLELTFDGRFEERLQWILFWFVVASVLVARIAIQQGTEYAWMYRLALAGATALVVFRFVDGAVIALCLLAVVLWCADKLTWDCTLIDDNDDASGEGLLQKAGLNEDQDRGEQAPDGQSTGEKEGDLPNDIDGTISDDESANLRDAGILKKFLTGHSKRSGQPHAPGLWVVYFSRFALPLFGVGQLFIPSSEDGSRQYVFRLLWVYVAAALALLLTTSFLGLRRYLRQRRLVMPVAIAGTWLGLGAFLIVSILALCVLLPRPNAEYSVTALLDQLDSKQQEASRWALLGGDAGEEDGKRIGDAEDDQQQNDQQKDDQQGQRQDNKRNDGQPGDDDKQGKKQGQRKNGKSNGNNNSATHTN